MNKPITVRLPEELVEFVDKLVSEGAAASRASVVARALARERRRVAAERDLEILWLGGRPHSDLEGLNAYVAEHLPDVDQTRQGELDLA
jgi:Arc/MetJ-type ribon-helix-helix transcriptional regulator